MVSEYRYSMDLKNTKIPTNLFFEKQCVRTICETINIITAAVDLFDKGEPTKAGALLGAHSQLLVAALKRNNQRASVKQAINEMKKDHVKFREQIAGGEDLSYVG